MISFSAKNILNESRSAQEKKKKKGNTQGIIKAYPSLKTGMGLTEALLPPEGAQKAEQ